MVFQTIYFPVSHSSAHRQWTVHTRPEQRAEIALMSCTKWHQPLTDLLVLSQQSQISFSLLSQSLFFVVTVSTAPLRQPETSVAGVWLAGLYSCLHRYKLCFRPQKQLCTQALSDHLLWGKQSGCAHSCCGVTLSVHLHSHKSLHTKAPINEWMTPFTLQWQVLSPLGRLPLISGGLSTPGVLNSRNPGGTPGCTEPRGCGNALRSFYTMRTSISLLLAQKY